MTRPEAAPSTKIVAELRRRIERGLLAPGDRVPSTREIVRRWGVAMATATKVLTTLRHEGLVRSVPGVGTVVNGAKPNRARSSAAPDAERPPSRRRRRAANANADGAESVGRDGIAMAAIAIADAEGLAALSMRRVAAELGMATMSLYGHVTDKDDLLLQMMDAACRELPFPAKPPHGWRARLELAGRILWSTMRRHPWLAPAMSVTRPQLITSGLAYTEWTLGALEELGLDGGTLFTAHLTLFNYVRGTALNLELEAEAEAASGLSGAEWMAAQERDFHKVIATGRFPVLARLVSAPYDFDLDVLFEFGLQRLLDGLALLPRHGDSASAPR